MKYTFWLKTGITFQLLTGIIHSFSFFNPMPPGNETEKQLFYLMDSYKLELGAGFTPTMSDIMNSFSISFMLLFLFGGLLNWYLLRKKVDVSIFKGIIAINVLVYGACFAAMCLLTFLPPIICTGLIFLSYLISYLLTFKNTEDKVE